MSIDEFLWMLDVPFWEDHQGNIVITPREVIENVNKYPEHRDKIEKCNSSFPIDVMKNKKDEWAILDGLHRLVKLFMKGEKVIRVRKIPREIIHTTARD